MLLFLTVTSLALQASVADTSPFRALPLPAPNRVRGASGVPGPDYWQQRADYVIRARSEEHTSELQSRFDLVCRLLLEKKKKKKQKKKKNKQTKKTKQHTIYIQRTQK